MRNNYYDYYFKDGCSRIFGTTLHWHWLKAMALAESALDPEAVSPVGAVGVMQLMPGTVRQMAQRFGIEPAPLVPHINIELGIRYAHWCYDWWKEESGLERIRFMLGSYNAGPGHILEAQNKAEEDGLPTDMWHAIVAMLPRVTADHAEETITYVHRVERFAAQLNQKGVLQ